MLKILFVSAFLLATVQCTPVWNPTYTVKDVLYIPYAELVEPFYAWYDGKNKQSRIDYYGGMAKTYQLGNYEQYGTNLKVVPMTTEEVMNSLTCLQVNGTSEFKVEPQSVLPSLIGFECIGSEDIDGKTTEKWRLVNTVEDKVNKYTLWLRYMNDPDDPAIKVAIPIRYEMKGYNTLFGSHYDHYYIDYSSFTINDIDQKVFEVNIGKPCTSFPGPGVDHSSHLYTFNPMAEFIHPTQDRHVHFEFDKFKIKHNKEYTSEIEQAKRKELFRQNLRFINSKNRAALSYTLSVNHLADRNELELRALRGKLYTKGYNGGKRFPYEITKEELKALPENFDWRLQGAVTPVKDQSVCGSCWSFGSTGTIEGAYFLKHHKLVSLSEQALIDCSWGFGNNGCDGGEDFRVYKWIMKHGGIPTEDSYGSYLAQDGYCHIDNQTLVAAIDSFVNVTSGDENALKIALFKHGPISVAIDASQKTFSFYSNGVYEDPKCHNKEDELDHAVLAVGYGTQNGKRYWLVKNSWSNYWGDDGYVLMAIDKNMCGVMTTPTYVNLKD